MSTYVFKLPDLGEGTVESEIVEWYVKPGDTVAEDSPLVDMMTDKATIEITSPVAGTITSLAGELGDMIAVGAELVVFDTENLLLPAAATNESPACPAAPRISPPPTEHPNNKKPLASPATRHRARTAGVDLSVVPGTGPKGRITKHDFQAYLEGCKTAPQTKKRTDTEEIKVIGLRRKIAEKMQTSKQHIPHFSYVEEVDVTELDALRQHLNVNRDEDQPKLSYLPFFTLALAKVLDKFPQCNATYDDDKGLITRHGAKHIGVATQTEHGLVVPVVSHVEILDLWQCAQQISEAAESARSGSASKTALSGATITISSLGALGGIVATPIINYPEVAIIGINKTQERPVIQNGTVTGRLMMNLSSSFDHRVVDGYDAASMIQAMKGLLEHPATIFI